MFDSIYTHYIYSIMFLASKQATWTENIDKQEDSKKFKGILHESLMRSKDHYEMMVFITLVKFKKKAESVAEFGNQLLKNLPPGVKVREIFWTLGEFDSIWIIDAPSEKEIFQLFLRGGGLEYIDTKTLVGMKREDALKLLT